MERLLRRSLAAAALGLAATAGAFADISGAIWASHSDGVEVNGNIFDTRQDVYLNGAGLPEGEYYVRVLSSENGNLLGTSVGASDETPVVVGSNGAFAQVYQLWSLVNKASDGSQGFDKPSETWCEYRVEISSSTSFSSDTTEADLFLAEKTSGNHEEEEEEEPAPATICVKKFYDGNANGTWDDGEDEIEGWKVAYSGPAGASGSVNTQSTAEYAAGTWTFTECPSKKGKWVATTPTTVTVTVEDGDAITVVFGNVCIGKGGAYNGCAWLSWGGQCLINSYDLKALRNLCLVDWSGCSIDPWSKSALFWYLFAGCVLDNDCYEDYKHSNMAFLLSYQLAVMTLNVRHDFVDGDCLVYAPDCGNTGSGNDFLSVSDLMDAANDALCDDGYTPHGDDDRDSQECLKNALSRANDNRTFCHSEPCEFGF